MDISKDILATIEKEQIKPRPRWEFLLKDYVIKGIALANIVFGSIGFAIIIYLISNNDAGSDPTITLSFWQRIIMAIPVLWIVFTLGFITISFYSFRHSDGGYKLNTVKLLIVSVIISLFLGIIINVTGLSERINSLLGANIPYYTHTFDTRNQIWMRPEEGYLAGKIVGLNDDNSLEIIDLDGKTWTVNIDSAVVKGRVNLAEGIQIKIIGQKTSEKSFSVNEIRPWMGMRGMM
jgi:hypothetical protein